MRKIAEEKSTSRGKIVRVVKKDLNCISYVLRSHKLVSVTFAELMNPHNRQSEILPIVLGVLESGVKKKTLQ